MDLRKYKLVSILIFLYNNIFISSIYISFLYVFPCTEAINGRGIKPIEAFLARNGGWPMIMESEEWNSEQLTWQEINEYYSRLISLSAFYHISVSFDHRETNSTDDLEDKDRVITVINII